MKAGKPLNGRTFKEVFNITYKKIIELAQKYNVSRKTFATVYILSFIPFYAGIIVIGWGLAKKNVWIVLLGFLLNRIAWASPYFYIEIKAGRKLNWKFHFALWIFLIEGAALYALTKLLNLPFWISIMVWGIIVIAITLFFVGKYVITEIRAGNLE